MIFLAVVISTFLEPLRLPLRPLTSLTISEAGVAVKYNVYLSDKIEVEFQPTDRSRVELAARLLRHVGVDAEVKSMLMEGWPRYEVGLVESALRVSFGSTRPDSIAREAQRLREVGLVEGVHFSVKMPEEGRYGYVSVLKEGLAYAAWLSVYGSSEQQKLAAEFVEYILQRAWEAGKEVYEKAREIIEEGKARGSLTLKGFEREVEVNGREHVVKAIGGGAELEESWSGRIRITAEVDGVRSDYTITFIRYGRINRTEGYSYARADVAGGREKDAERFSALVKAFTGRGPKVYRMKNGEMMIVCYEGHLEGFRRYTELADTIMNWRSSLNL